MKIGNYLLSIRGLMNLKRYQNLYLFKQRSVAEHSWSVAKTAQMLAYMEQDMFGNKVDMGLLLQKAICHDELEIITGDILSHTKRRTKAMKKATDGLERHVYNEEYSKNILPAGLADRFRPFTLDVKDGSIEGDLLKAADIIDTLYEAIEELELGNRNYFIGVFASSLEKLKEMELDSVQYFIQTSVDEVNMLIYEEPLEVEYQKQFNK